MARLALLFSQLMQNFIRSLFPASLGLCASLFVASITSAAAAPIQAGAPKASPAKVHARKAQEMVARVLRETSEVRGLKVLRGVRSGVKTRAEVEQMLRSKVKKDLPSKQLLGAQLFVRQLGLAPKNFDLQGTYIAMMGEQIAGYYETKTDIFVTTDRVDPLQLETVMAHELTHALQDQHFDLSRLEKWPAHDSDAKLAMSALVEGDATLVMSRYMARSPLRMLSVLASSLKGQAASPAFNAAPRILRDSVTFPYTEGLRFAMELHRCGGWTEVSSAYGRLPQSTEQILHFDKYLARDAPVKVELRDLTRTLGQGWQLLDHDVNGEIGLFLTVAGHIQDDPAARSAAQGWGGDRYHVYRGPKNAALVVQDCIFDSQFDARQWREAYARGTSRRFGFQPQKRGALQVWNSAPDGVWMEQKGKRVLILEGTIGSFNPTTVFAALRR